MTWALVSGPILALSLLTWQFNQAYPSGMRRWISLRYQILQSPTQAREQLCQTQTKATGMVSCHVHAFIRLSETPELWESICSEAFRATPRRYYRVEMRCTFAWKKQSIELPGPQTTLLR